MSGLSGCDCSISSIVASLITRHTTTRELGADRRASRPDQPLRDRIHVMDRSARFRINAPRVIHEPFEHEVVVVNLDTGRYYCLQKAGVDLWDGLMAGASIGELVDGLRAAYDETDVPIE